MKYCICFIQILVGISLAGEFDLIQLGDEEYIKPDFTDYYAPVEVEVEPKIPSYQLPLDPRRIDNYDRISEFLLKEDEKAISKLEQNGVVIIDWGKKHDIIAPFKWLRRNRIPVFVSSDVLLHLYGIQFLESLKEIEEDELFYLLLSLSEGFLECSSEQYKNYSGDLKEAAKRNTAFFSVAVKLLDPTAQIPESVLDQVNSEIEKIMEHQGFRHSDIFKYKEDYSQYVPRGHYTRGEELSKYFRAMIWYGRMAFLLKPKLVKPYDARIQTIQASLIAGFAETIRIDGETARQVWDRIYGVTTFYVGLADDLTLHDYMDSMREVLGTSFEVAMLIDDDCLFELKRTLALKPSPKIYGGTGRVGILPSELTPEKLDEILTDTKGFRLIGQRFVPDSYIFGELVAPSVGELTGKPCFTSVFSMGLWIRGFPRGLDVMKILGSHRADQVLNELGDDRYEGYHEQVEMLKDESRRFSRTEWNRNLYWSWLYVLKSLLVQYPDGYQSFMRTTAWEDKQLTTALASWTGLRHATILYVKQSYTPELLAAPPQETVKGYVEPVPEVYGRLLALALMTETGLSELGLLSEKAEIRLNTLIDILNRLIAISKKELENEELSEDDYEFIRDIDYSLKRVVRGLELQTTTTTFVCDVHTDINSQKVLEEGSGYVNLVIAAIREPNGKMSLAAGPVLSYHEFKQPLSQRLTDEEWIELLRKEEAPDEGW